MCVNKLTSGSGDMTCSVDHNAYYGVFIASQLNSTQLDVELSSVEFSCVAIDTLTDATQLSPAIGNATDPVAAYSQSARSRSVELS